MLLAVENDDVAVVDAGLPGLDTDAVATLSRWGVRVVSVGERDLTGIGIAHRVAADALETLGGAVAAAADKSNATGAAAAANPKSRGKPGSGVVVNVSSVLGFLPMPYGALYAATKHAIEGYSESLDHELRTRGIARHERRN